MDTSLLSDLMTFVTVADEMSFTKAANRLDLAHSVVSKRISRLEADLKVHLIHRTTRRLVLTEAGQALYERCAQIKKDLEEVTLSVSADNQQPHGTLRVNAPMSFGQIHLVPAVCDFMKAYPDIKVELVLGRQYANLLEHSLDISIQISELPNSSFVAKKLGTRNTHICATPEYFKVHGIPKVPEDLKNYMCLIYESHKAHDEWRFIHAGKEQLVKVQGDFHVNSSQAILGAAMQGMGVARLPGYLIEEQLKSGVLESVLQDYCPRDIGIYGVYPHNRHLAAKVRIFLDFLAKRFGGASPSSGSA
jgi:DNA-binding transcriptional LysR family regulator